MPLSVGYKLGPYAILAPIGAGGMGEVWKARDTRLDRIVAIKISKEKFTERFEREARSIAALNHPHICTLYDVGPDYLVMEYIEGKPLKGPVPAGEAIRAGIQIAEALEHAHAHGVVHRDLKPGNVIVNESGLVKVVDFGLAKLTEQGASDEFARTETIADVPQTDEGTIVGTISYMSPEQAEGRKVDARSDIFSFGAVLYEMATGQRAFTGSSKISTLAAILHSEPKPPAEIHPGLLPELLKIIQRCLRKDPAWRYHSAADVKIALHDVQHELESGIQEPAPRPASRRRALWPAVAVVAVLIAAALGWWFGSGTERPIPGPIKPLTTYRGYEAQPALSPDGNQVAFSWDGERGDNTDIYVRLVDGGAALRLTTDPAPPTARHGRRIRVDWRSSGAMRSTLFRPSAARSGSWCP